MKSEQDHSNASFDHRALGSQLRLFSSSSEIGQGLILWHPKGAMYSPITIDDDEYYLKPMNCPFHIQIYKSEPRSYRDLPIRYAEYGTVYRYELSNVLSGLTRVRGLTQDDAHIICTMEQIDREIAGALRFSLYILMSFGLEDFDIYVSTRPDKKFIGSDLQWVSATETLKKAVESIGRSFQTDEGGGAFYGPKIDIKLNDSQGRQWQCSTIQFDFNLPAL
jgi:threonyl-tRNA synthetase